MMETKLGIDPILRQTRSGSMRGAMSLVQAFFGVVLWASVTAAQIVPGHYVVELMEPPLGAEVRTKGKAALVTRHKSILSEQARTKPLIEHRRGRVLSSTDSLMNALIVQIPDEQAASLAALPGVKRVYPVYEVHMDLDHALPLHQVPAAWARIGGQNNAGAGVKIGILDTGITPEHPAFQDASLKPPPGFPIGSKDENLVLTNNKIIVARSYEEIYQPREPDNARDRHGHGTAVAMCAAGVANRGSFATITGVAPKAWIGGYKIVPLNSGTASGDVILKALDDALADGMDVINLSFGGAFQFLVGTDVLPGVALDRLSSFGVLLVVSAGNSGPGRNTMGDYASSPSVIAVGAMENDRRLTGSVSIAGSAPFEAFPRGDGTVPAGSISSTVLDSFKIDPTGLGCSSFPASSATGKIVLILRGVCDFEVKLNNAQAAGAVAAIIYTDAARPEVDFYPAFAGAKLPGVIVSFAAGSAIRSTVAANPSAMATVVFGGLLRSQNPYQLSSFSSKGPNWDFTVKPDMVAVGNDIYTAAQSVDETVGIYSEDGYTTVGGTSFSSPLVAGAAALVRGARPGLTVEQYRSLLINGAAPLNHPDGSVEGVQHAGAGVLNVESALRNTVTAFPTSLTFSTGSGALGGASTGDYHQFALTNVGKTPETYRVSTVPFDAAPGLGFSFLPRDPSPISTVSLTIAAGQTRTLYAYWTARLSPGEYQGLIYVEGSQTSTTAVIPYWYGVPTGIPREVNMLSGSPASTRVGTTVILYLRVTDDIGVPVTGTAALAFQGSATAGGGAVTLLPNVFFPNLRAVSLRLGPNPAVNDFQFTFGSLPPVTVTITGTPPPTP